MTFSNRNVSDNKPKKLFSKKLSKTPSPIIPMRPSVIEKQVEKQRKRDVKNNSSKKPSSWGFWRIMKILFWIIFDLCLIAGIVVFGWIIYIVLQAPDLKELNSSSFSQSSVILDNKGERALYKLVGNEDRVVLNSLDDISLYMKNAMLAAEDANFYQHSGISFTGIARAARDSFFGRSTGGSTITQQLIKMVVFAEGEENLQDKIERKIKEIAMARKLESKYSKDSILLLYLNKAPFRGNIYGIEKAANAFFGKSAKDLSLAESALLAGLPQAPGRYQRVKTSYIKFTEEQMNASKITSYEELIEKQQSGEIAPVFVRGMFGTDYVFADGVHDYIPGRVDFVLFQMFDKGFISETEYNQAQIDIQTLEIKEIKTKIGAPHFVFYAMEEVEKILKNLYGEDAEKYIHQRGLQITTTLDFKLNNEVQRIISEHGEKAEKAGYKIRNAAGLVLDSKTGAVLSMIGSRNYFAKEMNDHEFDGEVNVITSRRQPGSTFKALVYAAAFDLKGLAPATVLMDVETDLSIVKSQKYIPRNYDGKFNGPVTIRKALGNSLNIPAVKAGIIVGIPQLIKFTDKIGVNYNEDTGRFGPSMALGAAVVRPLDMGAVFAGFANEGKKVEPFAVLKIVDSNGKVLYERDIEKIKKEAPQVISPETAFLISDILSDETGKGRPKSWNKFLGMPNRPSAAKTGTSTGKVGKVTHPHDVWTIGYTPQRTALVWMGNNKGWKENPKGMLNDKASGLTNAANPWREIMMAAHKDLPVEKFVKPKGVKKISVSALSGKRIPEGFPSSLIVEDYFSVKSLPEKQDTSFKVVRLEESTQLLPNEFTPEKVIKEYTYIEMHSYFPKNEKWEKAVRAWLRANAGKLSANLGISNIIPFVPKEYTDKYSKDTEKNRPKISILSPSNMGIVSPPLVNIEVAVNAPNGVRKIDLLWDGQLVATKASKPWIFTIPLSETKIGSLHVLEAEITDELDYIDNASVNVKVGEDRIPPDLSFIYPLNGSNVERGTLIQVGVDAIDRNSSIKKINFFLDGDLIKTLNSRPYQFSWLANAPKGTYIIKATALDSAGNTATESISITITEEDNAEISQTPSASENSSADEKQNIPQERPQSERVLAIISPSSGEEISGIIPISFGVPVRMRKSGVSISVMARKIGGKKQSIFSIAGSEIPQSGLVNFSWNPDEKGEYSLYLQVVGKTRDFSSKIRVITK